MKPQKKDLEPHLVTLRRLHWMKDWSTPLGFFRKGIKTCHQTSGSFRIYLMMWNRKSLNKK